MIWVVSVLLLASVSVNLLLGWYIIKLVNEMTDVSDDLVKFYDQLSIYTDHVAIIYELETFYGDETLKNLLRHSKDIVKEMKVFRGVINATEEDYDFLDELEQYEDEEINEEMDEKVPSRERKVISRL